MQKPKAPAVRKSNSAREISVREQLDAISPELFSIYVRIRDDRNEASRSTVIFYWNLGSEFEDVAKKYKKHAAAKLAAALDLQTHDVRDAMRLRKLYPKLEDINKIMALRTATDRPLSWGHLRLLLSETLNPDRQAWIERCLADSMTAAELSTALQEQLTPRGNGALGGRPIVPPKSLPAALSKLTAMSTSWLKHAEIFGSSELMAKSLETTERERLSDATLDQLSATRDQLALVSTAATKEVKVLDGIVGKVRRALAAPVEAVEAKAAAPAKTKPDAAKAKAKDKHGKHKPSLAKAGKVVKQALAKANGKKGDKPKKAAAPAVKPVKRVGLAQ